MSRPPSPLRLAIVLSHPTQYYSPWFRWLQAHSGLTFRVFYLWDFGVTRRLDPQFATTFSWDVDLLSGYDQEFVPNRASDPGTHHFRGLDNPTLGRRLKAWRPDVVLLFGYKWRSLLQVVLWARLRRIPLVFRGDSHWLGRGRPGAGVRILLRALYAQFSAITYVGAANREYFRILGAPERKLFFAPHAIDHALFDPASAAHQAAAAALRVELGLAAGVRVVLFAGKLVPAKQPAELLGAFLKLNPPDTALVFVGDGSEKAALQEAARAAPPMAVHFLPFANQSEMPSRYLLADLFVLPSRGFYETWGLAVNEAMQMGVPSLVSDRVGCQRDLVTDGETGWVFRADEPGELALKLAEAIEAIRRDAPAVRRRVEARISGYTYRQTTDGLLAAIAALKLKRTE